MSQDGGPGPATRNHGRKPLSRFEEARPPAHVGRAGIIEQLDKLAGSGKPDDRERFSSLLVQLAGIDPSAAAEYVKALASGPMRQQLVREVSLAWASKDPAGAEKWAAGLPDASERQSALEDVCLQIVRKDGRQAIAMAEKHELDLSSQTVTRNLARQWMSYDLPAAAEWIKSRSAGEEREQMIMILALVQAETRPAEAGRLVVEEIPEGPVQTEAVISVIYQWAKLDPSGARAWVGLFPESPLRDRAESELSHIASFRPQTEARSE